MTTRHVQPRPSDAVRASAGVDPEKIEATDPRYQTRTVALVVIALVVSMYAIHAAAAFFVPLVVSIVLSYALSGMVDRLERWRVPRPLGAALIVALLIALGAGALSRAGDDAQALLEQLPTAVEKVRRALVPPRPAARGPLENMKRTATELEKLASAAAPAPAGAATPAPPAIDMRSLLLIGTESAAIAVGQLASVVFLTYFLLVAGDLFRRKLVLLVGSPIARQKTAVRIVRDIHELNQRYLGIVALINIMIGICTGVALYFIGLERAVTWGIVTAVLHMIPYVGVTLVTLAIGLVAYVQFGSVEMGLLGAATPLVFSTILGVWVQTLWLGRAARMNAPAVFVSLLFWGMLWGVWGLLLAMPITVAIKSICDHVESLRAYSMLLAPIEEPREP